LCEEPRLGLQQLDHRRGRRSAADFLVVSGEVAISGTVGNPEAFDFRFSFAVSIALEVAGAFAIGVAFPVRITLAVGEPKALDDSGALAIEVAVSGTVINSEALDFSVSFVIAKSFAVTIAL
jgi:uncharacterized membrane protein